MAGGEGSTEEQQAPATAIAVSSHETLAMADKKLTLVPLIFLIYFEVAGGPFGEEPAVEAAGPLLAILGFTIFPFIWSVPEALITAELSTAFPGNGGFVIWADQAFGPFCGFLMGILKYLSGVINLAAFPVLCINYLDKALPVFSAGLPRDLALFFSSVFLSFLNYTGLTVVGYTSVCLGMISLLPFILMSFISIPNIRPSRWIDSGKKKKDWTLFFNTLFWNLNFWDNVSTLAGEVDRPQKTFPLALLVSVIFTCFAYLLPLLAVTGALSVPQESWESGFFAVAADMIAGKWLKIWVEIGAVLSAIGLFEAQMSSCAYELLGMADLGFLPSFFAKRSTWFGTPWVGIVLSAGVTVGMSYMNFTDIVSSANFVYSLGMLLEFASFLWLRRRLPELKRPFRVPIGFPAAVMMCGVPSAFLVYIMVIASKMVFVVSGAMIVGVIGLFLLTRLCKSKQWFRFEDDDSTKEG